MNKQYRFGKDVFPKYSFKQRVYAKLFAVVPVLSNFFMRKTKKAYGLCSSISISKGFHCETPFLEVGEKSGLSNLYIHGCGKVTIGSNVAIAKDCKLINISHDLRDLNIAKIKPIVIENDAVVFTGSSILLGVKVGRGAVIGAFSVVRSDIPPYAIVSGNPCKVVKFRYTPDEAYEFESKRYPENERIPLTVLQNNYEKYYLTRIQEIKTFVSI